ncbi:Ig-like domain-containing protein, partial [Motilimonas eburnea]
HGPDITEVNISGGPISDSIYLDWVKLDGTNFKLEYPRIFPSLEENQSYTLTVKAIDSYGNTSTKSHSIDYIPNNLFTLTGVDVFATDELVLSKNGKPLSLITSNQLRSDNGNLASGEQQIFFTLRGDAPFGLYANGVRVRPGETKEVIYNLDSTDGRIYLPIYPDVKGVEGKANYLIEIPRIN